MEVFEHRLWRLFSHWTLLYYCKVCCYEYGFRDAYWFSVHTLKRRPNSHRLVSARRTHVTRLSWMGQAARSRHWDAESVEEDSVLVWLDPLHYLCRGLGSSSGKWKLGDWDHSLQDWSGPGQCFKSRAGAVYRRHLFWSLPGRENKEVRPRDPAIENLQWVFWLIVKLQIHVSKCRPNLIYCVFQFSFFPE